MTALQVVAFSPLALDVNREGEGGQVLQIGEQADGRERDGPGSRGARKGGGVWSCSFNFINSIVGSGIIGTD